MAGPYGRRRRNFGWGNKLEYAGRKALDARYGKGHFATQAAHRGRWRSFVSFLVARGIRDTRVVDREVLEEYAKHVASRVACEEISVAYGQNLLASANVVLEAIRGDREVSISPAGFVGKRCAVRETPPTGMDAKQVCACVEDLRSQGMDRAAAVMELARFGANRLREACLAELPRLRREAQKVHQCNIQDGCKGGRDAPRWVPASEDLSSGIVRALAMKPEESSNLIAPDERLIDFIRGELKSARRVLKAHGITSFRDLRAAYACQRYQELTGSPAAVLQGVPVESELDARVRKTIAQELGHGRIDVVAAYIGGRR